MERVERGPVTHLLLDRGGGSRWGDAERELDAELSLNPRYARAHWNLAVVLRHEGRLDEACAAARRAVAASPEGADDAIDAEMERDCGQSR